MSWVVVQKQAHDVVVSTYGRGFYIMHDITPLEQGMMEPSFTRAGLVGCAAYRSSASRAARSAEISFKLAAAFRRRRCEFEVLDSKGALVAKLPPVHRPRRPEPHRVGSCAIAAPRLVALRTTPPENPHIWEEPRFQGQDTRAVTHWGIEAQAERTHAPRPAITR